MKSYRKITGIILTICMIMQILPVFTAGAAEATEPVGFVYLINDDFGDGDTNGWSLDVDSGKALSDTDVSYIKAAEITDEPGNYALEYTAATADDARYSHISKVLDTSAAFAGGKDVVIETRLMQTSTATLKSDGVSYDYGRSYLKMNLVSNPSSNDEWNLNWGTLFYINGGGGVQVPNGWGTNGYMSDAAGTFVASAYTANTWYTVKATIKGETKTVDYEITCPDGSVVEKAGMSIDYPDAASWVENQLNSVDFRMRNANTMYIDYVRAYELFDAGMSTPSIITPADDIVVTIDAAEGSATFADALTLYDENGEVVETTNTIDSTNKVVTLVPEGMLKEGGKYTVKLDTGAVASNYSFDATEKQIVVSDITYYIYDEFGENDLNGWEAKVFDGYTSTNTAVTEAVEAGSENYMLTYTAADTNNSYYGYLSKAVDTAPAFSAEKNIVIEARMKQGATGRSFIKYNLDGTSYAQNEWNYLWGNLIMNQTGNVSLMNGWKAGTTGYYTYPSGFGGTAAVGGNQNVITGATDKWYTYKIIIHGGTAGENHTATGNTADYIIYDADGAEVVRKEGFSIDFPDGVSWGTESSNTTMSWVEDALNTLDFRLREATTLSIDYVKVYEVAQREAQLNIESGKYVKLDEDIVFNITTEATDLFMPASSVAFTNASGAVVEADAVYDKTAKTFTVKPAADLTIGEAYTLTFTDNEFVAFTGTTEFTVEARAAYKTGLIINDTFDGADSAETLDGWTEGARGELTAPDGGELVETLEVVTNPTIGGAAYEGSVLKFTSNGTNVNESSSGVQISAYRKLGDGVEFKEGKQIVVKTKVYQEVADTASTGRFDLRFNRPNTAAQASGLNDHQWLQYGIFRQNKNAVSVVSSFGSNSYPNLTTITNLEPANKWVEYTIVLDGVAQTMDITAVADGNTYTKNDALFDLSTVAYADIYGEGATTENSYVKALESLTFKNTMADEVVYIDYVQVYEEFDAKMLINGTYAPDEPVTVTFEAEEGSAAFADALTLYDADGEVVETTNTIDSTNKVVTLSHGGLTSGASYTVKLDMSKIPVNYVLTKAQASFTASDASYYIYDEFGENDLNGWEAKVFEGKTSTNTAVTEAVEEGSDNYMLTYTTSSGTNAYYGYLTKALTPIEITEGKSVVIEARMKQTGTGRSFLKYNLDGTSYYENEWQHNWGTLVQNDKGKVSVIKGWVYTSNGVYGYPKGFGVSDAAGSNLNVITDASGNWYTYKVILHGGETKDDVTADYIIYDADGVQLAKFEGLAIDFPDNSDWADVTAAGATNANWVEGVLNSVDFRLRDAETLNIDYVKVYEMGIAQATLANGRYNKNDEPIVLNVAAESNGVIIPDASVVLKNGDTVIDTAAEYDAEAGTLTVTHDGLATDGTVYTLTLTDSDYVHFIGTTSFEIEGRGDYEEAAVDDNFDDGTDGWAAGVSNITTTVEQTTFDGKGVLMITTTDESAKNADGYQPVAYKKLGNGFKVTEGKDIVIKTSIYQTAENMGRFDLKFNRPNSAAQISGLNDYTWMSYGLLRQADNKAALHGTIGSDNYITPVNFNNLDPVGKWVDYTLTIDGTNKKITATAVADNKTYTATGVFDLPTAAFEAEYGIGGAPAYVQAITSLTFKNTTANSPVYVDYIKVYDNLVMVSADIDGEIVELGEATEVYVGGYDKGDFSEYVKLYSGEEEVAAVKSYNSEAGTVSIKPETAPVAETTYKLALELPAGYDYTGSNEFTVTHKPAGEAVSISFDGGIDDWSATNNRISGEMKTEGTNNYLSVSASDILKSEAGSTSFTYWMPLDFMMDASGYTVLEAKIRATGTDYRKLLRLNADFTALESAKSTNTPWQINNTSGKVSSIYYCYSNDVENGCADLMGDYTEGKWYTVRTIYDNVNRMVSFILLDEDGNLISRRTDRSMTAGYGENEENPAAWWFNYKNIGRTDREKMRYIDNIALSLRSNATEALAAAETFDIDDIKLYNTTDVEGLRGRFEVSIVDANGNDVTGESNLPEAGGTFKTKVNYSLGTSKSFSVITVLYNEGMLETVKAKNYTDVTSAIEDVNEITIDSGADRSIKVFVWDSLNRAVPLMEPVVSSGTESVKIYVSTYGSDGNDGSRDAPVASLTAAQEIAKTYNENVTVVIEDGEYLISEPVNLDYNGTANAGITYKAVGGNAEIIAGVALAVNDAAKVDDEAILSRLVDENAKDYLYVLDLSSYDIPDAALPGVYSHTYLNAVSAPNLTTGQWVTEPKTTCEVFLEDEALTIARYPNKDDEASGYKGYMTVEKIVNAGAAPREWMSDKNTVAYDDRDITDVFKIGYTDEDTDGSRMDKWAAAVSGPEKDRPIMYGFWRWDWAVQSVPVAALDTENNVITSKYPSTYGMLTKEDSDAPASDRRFYVFNLLEEIDTRGEYFIDRTNKKLYFYKTDDMAGKRLMLSINDIDEALNVTGAYTTIDGLKVNTCQGTGIRVAGNNITVKNCEISNTADWAATVSGYNCTLKDSHIYNVNGGVWVSGGDAATFKAANHLIENNEFENFSRVSKLSVPAVQLEGVGNTVTHNEIHNAEHSAIMYGGVNNKITYNNIYDVCKESDDAGVIYAGRSWVTRGNEIKYNYIHDIASTITENTGASPIAGIFLDDHLAGAYIEGNIFENIVGDGIRGNGGREHTITNNIFVNCSRNGTKMGAPSTEESSFSTQIGGVEAYIGNEAWEEAYPMLFTTSGDTTVVNTEELMKANNHTYTKNFAAGCTTPYDFSAILEEQLETADISNNSSAAADVFGGDYSDIAGKVTGIENFAQIPFASIRQITD